MNVTVDVPALTRIAVALEGIAENLQRLNATADKINEALTPPSATRITFYVEEEGQLIRVGGTMFQKVTEPKKFAIKVTDRFGNIAQTDGPPAWAPTDETLAEVAVAADGMSAIVTPKGPVGSLKLQVNADADMGEGVKPLLGELDLDLVAGDAEVISIVEVPMPVEEPTPEPEPEPTPEPEPVPVEEPPVP